MKRVALCLWLALAAPLWGQSVKMPPEVKVAAGRLAAVTIEWEGVNLKWTAPDDLDIFREYDQDATKVRLRMIGYKTGRYKISAIASAKDGKLSDFAHCTLVVGDPGPEPGPGPDPKPPDPVPPGPSGKRVMLIEESAERGKLPREQYNVLFDQRVRDFLNAKCDAEPDGKTKSWGIFDQHVDLTGYSKELQALMKRERKSVPWLVVTNGKDVWEGPLPANYDETMKVLKKILGE